MRRILTLALLITLVLLATVLTALPVLAQGGNPPVPAQGLTLFTTYPAQKAAIGENVTFLLGCLATRS